MVLAAPLWAIFSCPFPTGLATGGHTKNIENEGKVMCSTLPSVLDTTDFITEGNLFFFFFFEQDLPVVNLFWLLLIICLLCAQN